MYFENIRKAYDKACEQGLLERLGPKFLIMRDHTFDLLKIELGINKKEDRYYIFGIPIYTVSRDYNDENGNVLVDKNHFIFCNPENLGIKIPKANI